MPEAGAESKLPEGYFAAKIIWTARAPPGTEADSEADAAELMLVTAALETFWALGSWGEAVEGALREPAEEPFKILELFWAGEHAVRAPEKRRRRTATVKERWDEVRIRRSPV